MNLTIKDLSANTNLDGSEMTRIVGGAFDAFLPLQPIDGESVDDAKHSVAKPVALNSTRLV